MNSDRPQSGQALVEFIGSTLLLLGTAFLGLKGVSALWQRNYCAYWAFELTLAELTGRRRDPSQNHLFQTFHLEQVTPKPTSGHWRSGTQPETLFLRGTLQCGSIRETVTLPCLK